MTRPIICGPGNSSYLLSTFLADGGMTCHNPSVGDLMENPSGS